jgi:hypothetical protein
LGLLVLYDPAQYPLARALCARYQDLELWYVPPGREAMQAGNAAHGRELAVLDAMVRERATQVVEASEHHVNDESLRLRLRELGVINPRAFIPGSRSQWRRSPRPTS